MATVIDTLLIELGFNGDAAINGINLVNNGIININRNVNNTSYSMEKFGDKGANAIRELKNEALLLLAIFTGGMGIKSFFQKTTEDLIKLDYTASNLNMEPTTLLQWERAAKKMGGTAQDAVNMIGMAQEKIAHFKMAPNPALFYEPEKLSGMLQRAYGENTDIGGFMEKAKKSTQGYIDVSADLLKKFAETRPDELLAAGHNIGYSDQQITMLKVGSEAFNKKIAAEAEDARREKEDLDNLILIQNQWQTIQNTISNVAWQILKSLMPAIEQLLPLIQKFANWLNSEETQKRIKTFINDLSNVWIPDLIKKANDIAESMGGWENVLIAIGAIRFAGFLGEIALVTAGLLSLAGAFAGVGAAAGAVTLVTGLASYFAGSALKDKIDKEPTSNSREDDSQQRMLKIVSLLKESGKEYGEAQIAAILGSMSIETGGSFDPKSHNEIGGGHVGLIQWGKARQKIYKELTGQDLKDASLEEQVSFMVYEQKVGEYKKKSKKFFDAKTISLAALAFTVDNEAPAMPGDDEKLKQEIAKRTDMALRIDKVIKEKEKEKVKYDFDSQEPSKPTSTYVPYVSPKIINSPFGSHDPETIQKNIDDLIKDKIIYPESSKMFDDRIKALQNQLKQQAPKTPTHIPLSQLNGGGYIHAPVNNTTTSSVNTGDIHIHTKDNPSNIISELSKKLNPNSDFYQINTGMA